MKYIKNIINKLLAHDFLVKKRNLNLLSFATISFLMQYSCIFGMQLDFVDSTLMMTSKDKEYIDQYGLKLIARQQGDDSENLEVATNCYSTSCADYERGNYLEQTVAVQVKHPVTGHCEFKNTAQWYENGRPVARRFHFWEALECYELVRSGRFS